MEIVYVLVGVALGVAIGWLSGQKKHAALAAQLDGSQKNFEEQKSNLVCQLETQKQDFQKQLETQKEDCLRQLENQRQELNRVFEGQLASKELHCRQAIEAQEKHNRESIQTLEGRFDETIAKVFAQMNTAAEDMLKKRQEEFAESSKVNIGQIILPLQETIDRMKSAMAENTLKQTAIGSEMKANIENMIRQNEQTRKTTDELARAFKHSSKVQGDWGEMVLDELLQSQGLTRGIHYDTQAVIKDGGGMTVHSETGAIMRPDIILHLDEKREVIIDSKVSMTAYFDYVNAETEEEKQLHLNEHIMSIRRHVKELSQKDYSSYIKPPKVKMDYVIMFVPHSGALWTALNAQPDLWRKAMEQNVFIADEQTLFAALRIINLTWTQIVQAENHERVYELANEMLNRIGLLWKEIEKMGKALSAANESFDSVKKKITDGGKSINTTARQLIKLGAKENDKNPLPAGNPQEMIAQDGKG